MTRNLDEAIEASGQRYLNLEMDLRHDQRADPSQAQALHAAATSHADGVARLLARVVLDWGGPREADFKAVLAYLDYVPVRMRRTAAGFPSPAGVESYLTLHFADRVAELLALRLIKEGGWPRWKVAAVTYYLQAHRVPTTTAALLRFAIETGDAEQRGFAIEAVRAIGDRELGYKLAAEIARARQRRLAVPADVRALAP